MEKLPKELIEKLFLMCETIGHEFTYVSYFKDHDGIDIGCIVCQNIVYTYNCSKKEWRIWSQRTGNKSTITAEKDVPKDIVSIRDKIVGGKVL